MEINKSNSNNNLKIKCERLQYLFNQKDFFIKLCQYSQNDLNQVIQNIHLIINYYVLNDDYHIYSDIKELFNKIKQSCQTKPYPVLTNLNNSYYVCLISPFHYKLLKSLFYNRRKRNISIKLRTLEQKLSFFPIETNFYDLALYRDVASCLHESFLTPSIIYKGILKQPSNHEQPIVIGQNVTTYYESILKERLRNSKNISSKTASHLSRKLISAFVSDYLYLALIPQEVVHNPNFNLEDYLRNNISNLIILPSRYELLMICAQNKSLADGTKISYKNGQPIEETHSKDSSATEDLTFPKDLSSTEDLTLFSKKEFPVTYVRYENISITDKFFYTNPEFTGDIDYDLDLIYGLLDYKDTRSSISSNFTSNLSKIKSSNDIFLRCRDNKYYISNGRHRLLYLKHYYVRNYSFYQEHSALDELKNQVTIPILVEHAIEDVELNKLFSELLTLFPDVKILKADISNDDFVFLIIMQDKAYSINNQTELKTLLEYLKLGHFINPYFISYSTKTNVRYQDLFDYLIITLKEKLLTINIIDIINFIKSKQLIIDNQIINIEELNLYQLYVSYTIFIHSIEFTLLHKQEMNFIEMAQNRIDKRQVSKRIMDIVENNPYYLQCEWSAFLEYLHHYPEFDHLEDDYLKECAKESDYFIKRYKVLKKI